MTSSISKYEAMNLSQIAARYHVSVFVLKSWLLNFCPDLSRPEGTYTYTPHQVAKIVEACGEFPEQNHK